MPAAPVASFDRTQHPFPLLHFACRLHRHNAILSPHLRLFLPSFELVRTAELTGNGVRSRTHASHSAASRVPVDKPSSYLEGGILGVLVDLVEHLGALRVPHSCRSVWRLFDLSGLGWLV